jgi:hypothetical protein
MKPQPTGNDFAAFIGIDWADAKHDICLQASGRAPYPSDAPSQPAAPGASVIGFGKVRSLPASAHPLPHVDQLDTVTYHAPAQPVTYHAPTPPRRKRRRRPIDPVQEKNRELFEAHQTEIRRRLAAGQKPSQLAAWLTDLGFVGTGAALNRFLK